MPEISVTVADRSEYGRALETIARSFAADPMLRWMIPNDADFQAAIPEIFASFAEPAFADGTTYMTTDGAGVALWLAPGAASDSERFSAALRGVVAEELRPQVGAVFGALGTAHARMDGAWCLPMIGVDPAWAGQGHGSALMQFALRRCDAEGRAAYLDSSNLKNTAFYQKQGFAELARIQHGSSPIIVAMARPASSG